MKKITILFLIIFVLGCSTSKSLTKNNEFENSHPYLLHGNIQLVLVEKLKSIKDSVFFLLDKNDEGHYEISIRKYNPDDVTISQWIKASNRYVYLNHTFYPLFFQFDYIFSTPMTIKVFKKNIQHDGTYIVEKYLVIDEYAYTIVFTKNGEIIKQGYY